MGEVSESVSAYMDADTPLSDEQGTLDALTIRKNSLGSEYIAFQADRDTVLNLARLRLEDVFRRVVLDPVRGLIVLMSPSRLHETIADRVGSILEEVAAVLGLDNAGLRSTRWRRFTDPENTGLEADCCFYLGERAQAYLDAATRSREDGDRYVLTHAPDLVIEIGVTHVSNTKQDAYQSLGVAEYWQVDVSPGGDIQSLTVRFLALQADRGPEALETSVALPGVTPKAIGQAVQKVFGLGSTSARRATILEVMEKYGVVEAKEGGTSRS